MSGAMGWAAPRGEAPAIVDGDVVWSWTDLDRRADAIADAIDARFARAGRIGLAVGPSAIGIAALHGVTRAGVSTVLVHPRLTTIEMERLLTEADAVGLVVDPGAALDLPPGRGTLVLDIGELDAASIGSGLERRTRVATIEDAEFLVPTSGTTARPRIVCLPLDRIAASATAWTAFLPPATGWLLSLGLGHVAGIGIVVRASLTGVPVVTVADRSVGAMLAAMAGARDHHDVVVSHLSLVASQLAALLDETADAPPPDGIRAVILGGGPIPPALLERALDAGWPVIPSYGLTETASGVVALPTDEVRDHVGTVGWPLPGVSVRIDDDRHIAIRGPMTFTGYLGEVTNPADAWIRTGDLGRLDPDGRLTVLGRADDVIIRGGENIAPAEVEAALLEHPGIAATTVVGVTDPTWGAVPVAIIVPSAGDGPDDAALDAHLTGRLARFKLPARYIRVRALPRNDLGKVVRPEALRLASGTTRLTLADGQVIAIRDIAGPTTDAPTTDAPTIVLLHATLSISAQLGGLARRLRDHARVISIDRRGSGDSRMADPTPVPVERHAADVIDVLDDLGIRRAHLFGHSFGGVVALRVVIRDPERFSGLVVWEPPYLVLAEPAVVTAMRAMTADVARRHGTAGPAAAARRFLEGISGPDAWERLNARQRAAIGAEGDGVLTDTAMEGLTADGLDAITIPTLIMGGDASEPFYQPIADAVTSRIGHAARRVVLPGLAHMAPITDADAVAAVIVDLLRETTT